MPLFITVNGPAGPTSFTAESLSGNAALDGHLLATGITGYPVTLPGGRVFLPNVWSFRPSDLISYMAGQYEDTGPMDIISAFEQAEAGIAEDAVVAETAAAEPKAKRKSR